MRSTRALLRAAVAVGARTVDVAGVGSFHHVWLRDHCRCAQCFHPVTRQRLVDTFLIPEHIRPDAAQLEGGGRTLRVVWNDQQRHVSAFDIDWLRSNAYPARARDDVFSRRVLWQTSDVRDAPPAVAYDAVMQGDEGLRRWLLDVAAFGFAFVTGVPATVEATERLARRVSFIRETIFGGFWDFKPDLAHADTAYTTLALNAHTDTTYFSDPVGLQMFHLIEFNGVGGNSLLVDGFRVAEEMRAHHPDDFRTFATVSIPSQYLDPRDKIDLRPVVPQPVFVTDRRSGDPLRDEVLMVRYNNDDRGPLCDLTADEVEAFYRAHRTFNRLVRDPAYEYRFQLHPGTVLLFDNQRVLHGRTAFTGVCAPHAGQLTHARAGNRRLVGCYLNGDDYRSRLRGLVAPEPAAAAAAAAAAG